MPATERTLGVLVAGGLGARLGAGAPKALVPIGGMTLLERALATLAPVSDELVVAAPAGVALPIPAGIRACGGGAPRRADDRPGARGPLAGMVAGFAAARFARALVLGVHSPLMTPRFLAALLERLAAHPAVVPAPGGIAQPLAAAYAPAAAATLATCHEAGEAAPTRALASLAARLLGEDEIAGMPGGLECLFNLNTAADRIEAERRLKARTVPR